MFNEHFANAGHLFENDCEETALPVTQPEYEFVDSHHAQNQFRFDEMAQSNVMQALKSVNIKKGCGAALMN